MWMRGTYIPGRAHYAQPSSRLLFKNNLHKCSDEFLKKMIPLVDGAFRDSLAELRESGALTGRHRRSSQTY